jgi:hypothetical protein
MNVLFYTNYTIALADSTVAPTYLEHSAA